MIKSFIQNYPKYVSKMRNCSYHADGYLNLHHLEGDVWSHTMLSFSKGLNFGVSKIVLLSLLLHDIGRIKTRSIDDGSITFGNFEGVSCFIALDILNKFDLSEDEKVKILKVIMHQYNIIDFVKYEELSWDNFIKKYQYDEELLKDLFSYVKCDLFGRIIDKSKSKYYSLSKMLQYEKKASMLKTTTKPENKNNKDVYVLVGLPCTRKTTWIAENFPNGFIISRDWCVCEIGKKYGLHTFDESSYLEDTDKKASKEVDDLYDELIEKSHLTNSPVIIDNTTVTVRKRRKWINKYKNTHNIYAVVFLKSFHSIVECNKKRIENENKTISEKLILKQMMNFKFPLLNEGFHDIKYIF